MCVKKENRTGAEAGLLGDLSVGLVDSPEKMLQGTLGCSRFASGKEGVHLPQSSWWDRISHIIPLTQGDARGSSASGFSPPCWLKYSSGSLG